MIGIEQLGDTIDRQWRRGSYSEAAFSAIAAEALTAFDAGAGFFSRAAAWALADHAIPRQLDIEAAFGQPPLCLYINPMHTFFIQALIWLDSTTAVHQHAFSGAFKVVEGQSLHSVFEFTPGVQVNSRMMFGELRYLDSEVLPLGKVRTIEQGESFIHSVFHLDHPSVTLVVRTFSDAARAPQYEYLRPCLAVDPFYKSERLQRNLQVLTALRQVDRADYLRSIRELIASADLYSAYRYVRHFLEGSPGDDERDAVADATARVHGELGGKMFGCIEQAGRDAFLIDKRKALRGADHRFFLALLLNVPVRATILRLIEERFQREPIGLVEQWIDELCTGDDPALLPLDDSTLYVFKSMLRGASFDGVVRDLHEEFAADDVADQLDDLRHLYDKLRSTSYFGPILRV